MNRPSPPQIYFVGSDTSAGKTTLLCALLEQARRRGVRALPFKPAQSGASPDDPDGDAARLALAAGLPPGAAHDICPLWFAAPVAPGLAAEAALQVAPIDAVQGALERAITAHAPELVLLEGAGGLLVPMPGGTWQPDWLAALATHVVIIARAGLGTINHTLLTVEALRQRKREPLGIFLCEVAPPDASNAHNGEVIARAAGVPVLGTLPHRAAEEPATPDLLGPLLATLQRATTR